MQYQKLSDLLKKKKTKPLKNLNLLGKKTKRTTKKSAKQQLLDKLMKKTIPSGGIESELANQGYKASPEEINYYSSLYKSKVDIKSWGISQTLISNPITTKRLTKFNANFYTSDYYFLTYLGFLAQTKEGYLQLKSVYITSARAIVLDKKEIFEERYTLDFDTSISSPNWVKNLPIQGAKLTKINWYLFGKKHTTFEIAQPNSNTVYVIGETNATDEFTQKEYDILNKAAYLKDKNHLTLGMKQISKSEGAYYFQMNIVPTKFCPTTLFLKEKMNSNSLFTFEVDPDSFVEKINNEQRDSFPINLMASWENLNSVMELFAVIWLTQPQVHSRMEPIYTAYNYYIANKKIASIYKTHFKLFERTVLLFLDAFTIKISIDKMNKILDSANTFLNEESLLEANDSEKQSFLNFLNALESKTMLNFMNANPKYYISLIKNVCEKILNPSSDSANLEKYVRAVGLKLQNVLFEGEAEMILEIRSQNSFLANTIGDYTVDTLKATVLELVERVKAEKLEKEKLDLEIEDLKNQNELTQITNTEAFLKEMALAKDIPSFIAKKQQDLEIKKQAIQEKQKPDPKDVNMEEA